TAAAAMARSLTNRPGLPSVSGSLRCSGGRGVLELSQRRHTRAGVRDWPPLPLPVCVAHGTTRREEPVCTVLVERHARVALPSCPKWWLIDADASSYMHVDLDPGAL